VVLYACEIFKVYGEFNIFLFDSQEIIAKPLDEIPKRTPIPRMLIPYLHQISEDDYCLFALAQIVKPRPYPGTRFQRDDLLLGILKKGFLDLSKKNILFSIFVHFQ
jgi:hypothetical protein